MWSRKIRLDDEGNMISVATTLVLMAINELQEGTDNVVYGYQIMQHLRDKFKWKVKSGTIYPILKKLNKDNLIKKEIARKKGTNRQQIFYKITEQGKILVTQISSLNDDALESALAPDNNDELKNSKKPEFDDINIENLADNYLTPLLAEVDKKINEKISTYNNSKDLETLVTEIEKSIERLESCKILFQGNIEKIKWIIKSKK
jgi:DNA-binding PadR family transcriptional regulator